MICRVCGCKIPEGFDFCPVCGTRMATVTSNEVVKVVKPETEVDFAQLAQIIMDEGTFRYSRSPKTVHDIHHNEYWGYYPRCRIRKYDEEDIKHFAKLLNVEPRLYRGSWSIEFSGDKLLRILNQTKLYFRGEKLPQIEIILKHGKFYIPKEVTPPPFYLSLVRPELLMEYLKKKVEITPAQPRLRSPTPKKIETMRELSAQGLSSREIAEIVGYSHSTVLKYVK